MMAQRAWPLRGDLAGVGTAIITSGPCPRCYLTVARRGAGHRMAGIAGQLATALILATVSSRHVPLAAALVGVGLAFGAALVSAGLVARAKGFAI
jgi:hypothetical protein